MFYLEVPRGWRRDLRSCSCWRAWLPSGAGSGKPPTTTTRISHAHADRGGRWGGGGGGGLAQTQRHSTAEGGENRCRRYQLTSYSQHLQLLPYISIHFPRTSARNDVAAAVLSELVASALALTEILHLNQLPFLLFLSYVPHLDTRQRKTRKILLIN